MKPEKKGCIAMLLGALLLFDVLIAIKIWLADDEGFFVGKDGYIEYVDISFTTFDQGVLIAWLGVHLALAWALYVEHAKSKR